VQRLAAAGVIDAQAAQTHGLTRNTGD